MLFQCGLTWEGPWAADDRNAELNNMFTLMGRSMMVLTYHVRLPH
jgi:hypothetical protein